MTDRETVLAVNRDAAGFFRACLAGPEGEKAIAFLKDRGISSDTIERFGIGYAPDSKRALRDSLTKKYRYEDLFRAGLLNRRSMVNPFLDAFQNRIMFPIKDENGTVTGFAGRRLDEKDPVWIIRSDGRNGIGLLACSVARGGACGEPGSVKMLMENGALYHFSFIESGILPGKLRACIEGAGLDGFAYLGLENSLFFRAADSDWLMRKRDEYMQFSGESFAAFPNATLYKKWADFFRERIEENV